MVSDCQLRRDPGVAWSRWLGQELHALSRRNTVILEFGAIAAPTSKAQLARWHRHTVLTRLLPATAAQLSSQAFWNHMDRVSQKLPSTSPLLSMT